MPTKEVYLKQINKALNEVKNEVQSGKIDDAKTKAAKGIIFQLLKDESFDSSEKLGILNNTYNKFDENARKNLVKNLGQDFIEHLSKSYISLERNVKIEKYLNDFNISNKDNHQKILDELAVDKLIDDKGKKEILEELAKNIKNSQDLYPELKFDSFKNADQSIVDTIDDLKVEIKRNQNKHNIIDLSQQKKIDKDKTTTDKDADAIEKDANELTNKQLTRLQEGVANCAKSDLEKENIKKLTPLEFQQYLNNDTNKETVDQALKYPALQKDLEAIEKASFKASHEKHKDSFKNIDWQPDPQDAGKKTQEIKNKAGETLCTLKEETVKSPYNVKKADGATVAVDTYRKIDFPVKLDNDKGPLHVSMALKDSKGNNMPEDGAVYFEAHYNKAGKLSGVTAPVPVKFMGKGNDAIGYVERNGEIYTLPVTQGKYKEMMTEVAKNKGFGINLSQQVEQDKSQDKVVQQDPVTQQVQQMQGKLTKKETTEELRSRMEAEAKAKLHPQKLHRKNSLQI